MIPHIIEAGCDEAGRGPLAGSVFAAAVVLDPLLSPFEGDECMWNLLNDSKQLTEHQREQLRPWIEEKALAWAVVEVTAEEIDRINILQASLAGMRRALDCLIDPTSAPCPFWGKGLGERGPIRHILVDGNKWRDYVAPGEVMATPATTVVKGDGQYMSIAAASILAKTYRDEYMRRLAAQYPGYGWEHNMGYPTREHYEAIRTLGITPVHRRTFKLKMEN